MEPEAVIYFRSPQQPNKHSRHITVTPFKYTERLHVSPFRDRTGQELANIDLVRVQFGKQKRAKENSDNLRDLMKLWNNIVTLPCF